MLFVLNEPPSPVVIIYFDYSKGYILEKLVKLKKRSQLLLQDFMIKNMKFMNQ